MKKILTVLLMLPLLSNSQEVLKSQFGDSVTIYRNLAKKSPYIILERELDKRKAQFKADKIALNEAFASEKTLVRDNYPAADFARYEPEIRFYNEYLLKRSARKVELEKSAKPLYPSCNGCKMYIEDPLDSLIGVVKMVELHSGYHLYTVDDIMDSTRINYSYNVVKEERGSRGNSLVNISAKYDYKDKIINGDVVSVRTGMSSLSISAPRDVMCKVLSEFKKNISDCIIKDGGSFILFGAKEKPYRALVYVDCGGESLFGSLQILSF